MKSSKLASMFGFFPEGEAPANYDQRLAEYANIKLSMRGCPTAGDTTHSPFMQMGKSILTSIQQKNRLLAEHLCPADQYIQDWLSSYLGNDYGEDEVWLPTPTLSLDHHGLARTLSLPAEGDRFVSDLVQSYRVKQGVCHNPRHDRRTTKGVFHVAEGGLPIPADKKIVPKSVFAKLLQAALNPPSALMKLPFTSEQEAQAETWVSLLLRPVLCPEVPGLIKEKRIEVRFFAPGNLVSNLDFVESIFGNAGDPFLPEHDARLDTAHWSGHSGCAILAPHLSELTKKELGLPYVDQATDQQKKDGMCWSDASEKYNEGGAFKITARDNRGVMVTLIADNYFGYCKKEIKTQLSFAANLFGLCEEEHAGGALTFPSFDLGEEFHMNMYRRDVDHTFAEVINNYSSMMNLQPEGYGIDTTYPDIYYIPEDVHINLRKQTLTWKNVAGDQVIKLQPHISYLLPSGYKVRMEKPEHATRWRLVGTDAEGTFCHKPCTVSGGGKSEISKPITDAMISGPVLVNDFESDFKQVQEIIYKDYADRYKNPTIPGKPSRPLLSEERSFGSVVKLLSPNADYTDTYNTWLTSIPRTVRDLVLVVKRFYKPHWGEDWLTRFRVDLINGVNGHELKYRKKKLVASYLRVGFTENGNWRVFALRKDYCASHKLQMEDDITGSIVMPFEQLTHLHPDLAHASQKFVANCEHRLFQRPDEAITRGYDKQAEYDFGRTRNFFSNYEALDRPTAIAMHEDTIGFDQYTEPLQDIIKKFINSEAPDYFVSTAHPRLIKGAPTKNPRYLQNRPDLESPRDYYLGHLGARLHRRTPPGEKVPFPVNATLPGRRNNPPDKDAGIRSLAVYSPIHYQELPELFMDFIASLTGKSPSTTGAGSEGALTKGPFNALPPIIDLNNALTSFVLTQQNVFSSAAGHIGPKYRVDHDVSLIVPEIWSRMFIHERDPETLLGMGCLEKIDDFEHNGKCVKASRLGYRINKKFCGVFLGRVFSDPGSVFSDDILQPERQDLDSFADGINNIVETQERIAKNYFEDGSIDWACPPLKALLHIMAHGSYEGKTEHDPAIRNLFTKQSLIESDWYSARLNCKAEQEQKRLEQQIQYLTKFLKDPMYEDNAQELNVPNRLKEVKAELKIAQSENYRKQLVGTLGTDPALYRS